MKFKIPFLKKKEDDMDEVGPDNGLGDELDYLEPSKLQKRLPWIAVVGAYVLTFVGIAGVIAYLVLNADHIDPFYLGVVEAAEEAVINAVVAGEDVVTVKPRGLVCGALPIVRLRAIFAGQ